MLLLSPARLSSHFEQSLPLPHLLSEPKLPKVTNPSPCSPPPLRSFPCTLLAGMLCIAGPVDSDVKNFADVSIHNKTPLPLSPALMVFIPVSAREAVRKGRGGGVLLQWCFATIGLQSTDYNPCKDGIARRSCVFKNAPIGSHCKGVVVYIRFRVWTWVCSLQGPDAPQHSYTANMICYKQHQTSFQVVWWRQLPADNHVGVTLSCIDQPQMQFKAKQKLGQWVPPCLSRQSWQKPGHSMPQRSGSVAVPGQTEAGSLAP